MTDFTSKRVCAVVQSTFREQATTDASGDRHIKQGPATNSRAVLAFPQGADHGVAIHDGTNAKTSLQSADEVEVAPAGNVSGTDHTLRKDVDRAAETDS